MPISNKLLFTTATAVLTGSIVSADVTPEDVWEQWQSMFGLYGDDSVSIGSVERKGDTLTVSNLTIDFDENGLKMNAVLPKISMQDLGNGTVAITTAPEFSMSIVDNQNIVSTSMEMVVRQEGLSMIASGEPDSMNYAVLAKSYSVEVDGLTEDGEEIPLDFSFVLNNVNGSYLITKTDVQDITYALNADNLTFNIDLEELDEDAKMSITGQIKTLVTEANASLPLEPMGDFSNVFAMGLTTDATYKYASSDFAMAFADQNANFTFEGQDQGGLLSVALNSDSVSYQTNANGMTMLVRTAEFPFPIEASMAEAGFGLTMPVGKSDVEQPFGLSLNFIEMAVNDGIWNLFDPGEVLPRDPATISLDLTGTGKWNFDIFDVEQAEEIDASGGVHGELNTLDLNSLKLAIAGAEVQGEGGFTFDNTDLESFGGLPRPEGEVNLEATGVNGLIDKVVELGFVPEDQVMGARMMLGLFAVASETEDKLTSNLQIDEQGHVTANGQRLR